MAKRKSKPEEKDVHQDAEKIEEPEAKESSPDPSDRKVDDWVLTPAMRNRWTGTGIGTRHAVYRGWGETLWHKTRRKVLTTLALGECALIGGVRGTGKTQILADACLHFITSGKKARYINALDLSHRLRDAAMGDGMGLKNLHDFMLSMDLLCVDEIQDCSDTDFSEVEFRLIIDKRYSAKRATLIAGNIDEESAVAVLGDSIIRRINDGGGMVMCDWEPFDSEKGGE